MADCKYINKNGTCGLKGNYAYRHKCYTKDCCKCYEPLTNADRIRNMSNEELARNNVIMIRSSSFHKLGYELVYRCSDKYETDDYDWAIKHELDWLRQPPADVYSTGKK